MRMSEDEERVCRAVDQRMSDQEVFARWCLAADDYGKPRIGFGWCGMLQFFAVTRVGEEEIRTLTS